MVPREVGSVLSQSLVQVQVAHPVLDLPCRRHDLQHRPPAKSADQLVNQPVDVGHGVRLSTPEKRIPWPCVPAEAVGRTNRLIMAVVPGTGPSTARKSKSMAKKNKTPPPQTQKNFPTRCGAGAPAPLTGVCPGLGVIRLAAVRNKPRSKIPDQAEGHVDQAALQAANVPQVRN